jgi:hypothetical protein
VTTTPATTTATLWRAILAAPLDAAPKLALCDHLEETGRDPDLLAGLRYCVVHSRWPSEGQIRYKPAWSWYEHIHYHPERLAHLLPKEVWRKISGQSKGLNFCGFGAADARSPETAVRRLGRAVRQLGVG